MLSSITRLAIATGALAPAVAATNSLAGMKIETPETITNEAVFCPQLRVLSRI